MKISGTHYGYRLSQHHSHTAAGRIRQIEKKNNPINSSASDSIFG
jgi:hypothetical protein